MRAIVLHGAGPRLDDHRFASDVLKDKVRFDVAVSAPSFLCAGVSRHAAFIYDDGTARPLPNCANPTPNSRVRAF